MSSEGAPRGALRRSRDRARARAPGSRTYSGYNFPPHADLRHWRQHLDSRGRHAFLIGTYNARDGQEFSQSAYDVVVDGTVADSGRDIDPRSFSLRGGLVRWARAGAAREAPLG